MNRKLTAIAVGIGMMAMGMMVSKAHASYTDYLPANDTAQITVTIAPRIDRSVTISTDTAGMLDLGGVNLGALVSTQTVSPATVTVQGTIANTDLWLSANIVNSGGGTAWQFETDSTTVRSDYIATWVTLTDPGVNTPPAQDANYFNGTAAGVNSDLVDGSFQRVGHDVAGANSNGRFENLTASKNFGAGTTLRHMWMYFRMPSGTTAPDPEKITFVLTVDAGI